MANAQKVWLVFASVLIALSVVAAPAEAQRKPKKKAQDGLLPEDRQKLRKLQPQINAAIDKGVDYLIRHQNRDGSWSMMPHYRCQVGLTALCVYTLLKSDVPVDHPAVTRGLVYLTQGQLAPPSSKGRTAIRRNFKELHEVHTYDAGLLLMVLEATKNRGYVPLMQSILDDLTSFQQGQGTFSYRATGARDMSNTQYGALGLRAAELAGLRVKPSVYNKLIDGGLEYQMALEWKERPKDLPMVGTGQNTTVRRRKGKMPVAGFRYRVGGVNAAFGKPTGSMTCGGVSVMAICRIMLERQRKLDRKTKEDLLTSEEAGIDWLMENFSVVTNPNMGGRYYYYMYGLERVGSILDIEYIGKHAWYVEGAGQLVNRQTSAGNWSGEPQTCFAILFLKRATRVVTTGGAAESRKAGKLYISEGADSDVHVRARGNAPMHIWVSGFSKAAKQVYGQGSTIKGLRIALVEYLIDGKVVKTLKGNPRKGWTGAGFQTDLSFKTRGAHKIGAKVHLVDPDSPRGNRKATVVLHAEEFEVSVRDVLEPWMVRAAEAGRRNLLVGMKPKVTTSSEQMEPVYNDRNVRVRPGTVGENAVDGFQSTYWGCNPKDEKPSITLDLGAKPVTARTISLGQLNRRFVDEGSFDRITKVAIVINGASKAKVVELEADALTTTYIDLGSPMSIKTLQIVILEREPGKKTAGVVGFTEIGLEANE